MIMELISKGARTLILTVLISALAAGFLTIWIWSQPQFVELLAKGNFWFVFSTFLTCWLMASIMSSICLSCATHRPQTISTNLAD